ncbi:hypothetical protein ACFOEQ_09015 [Chryseobacterium arachidis]
MDEDITSKVADALMIPDELSDWSTRNIFPPNLGDHIADEVEANILIHKYYYIHFLIKKVTAELEEYRDTDTEKYFESIKKIMMLNQFSIKLVDKLGWSPITKI